MKAMQTTSPPIPESLENLDYTAFGAELEALHQRLVANISEADFKHLRKIEGWGRLSSFLGYATAWLLPNPISGSCSRSDAGVILNGLFQLHI